MIKNGVGIGSKIFVTENCVSRASKTFETYPK